MFEVIEVEINASLKRKESIIEKYYFCSYDQELIGYWRRLLLPKVITQNRLKKLNLKKFVITRFINFLELLILEPSKDKFKTKKYRFVIVLPCSIYLINLQEYVAIKHVKLLLFLCSNNIIITIPITAFFSLLIPSWGVYSSIIIIILFTIDATVYVMVFHF